MNISENCMFRAHIAAMCIMGRGPISSSRIRHKRRGAVQPFSQRGTHRRHAEEFKQEFCKTNFMVATIGVRILCVRFKEIFLIRYF